MDYEQVVWWGYHLTDPQTEHKEWQYASLSPNHEWNDNPPRLIQIRYTNGYQKISKYEHFSPLFYQGAFGGREQIEFLRKLYSTTQ